MHESVDAPMKIHTQCLYLEKFADNVTAQCVNLNSSVASIRQETIKQGWVDI